MDKEEFEEMIKLLKEIKDALLRIESKLKLKAPSNAGNWESWENPFERRRRKRILSD